METATATKQTWPGFMSISETAPLQLQQHDISPTQPPPRKKLRESCNNCALSKVKCSKDQPSCVRCEDRGIYCHYSPSRRTGKRRASSSLGGPTHTASISLGSITPPDETLSYEWHQDLGRAFTPDFSSPIGINHFNHALPESQVNRILSESLMPWDDTLFSCGLDSPTFDYSVPSSGTSSYGASSLSDINMLDQSSDTTMSNTPSSFDGGNPGLPVLPQTSAVTPTSCSYRQNCHMSPIDGKNQADQGQDCMTLALNILQGLHIPPSGCSFTSPGGCSASDGGGAVSMTPTIDHVLSTNKSIIDSVIAILNCPCSLDAQLALVLTLIGSKIIAWYSAVAANDDAEPGSAVSSCPNGNSLATSERVLLTPVTVGKYHLDGADKCKMRAQLVLSEMHRVVRLVEQLVRRFGEVGALGADGGFCNARALSATMCVELEAFLRNRVRAVTKQSMDVLRES